MKEFLRSTPVQIFLAWLIASYMMLVRRTTAWTIIGSEFADPIYKSGKGVVWCYWHSRIMGAHSMWPRDVQPMLMLISLSRDGGFVARAAEMVGRFVVRGSSSKKRDTGTETKGGLQAFRAMASHAKKGGCVGITPDGPSGPRMRAQEGAIRVAKAAGVPLLPSAYAIKGGKYVNSWDRFFVPPLFSKGVIIFGHSFDVPPHADEAALEEVRVILENELTKITQEADSWAGGPKIEPADPIVAQSDEMTA